MTETATTRTPFRLWPFHLWPPRTDASPRPAAQTFPSPQGRPRLTLPAWLPRTVLRRGAAPTRDDERALDDLRAALDRSDW